MAAVALGLALAASPSPAVLVAAALTVGALAVLGTPRLGVLAAALVVLGAAGGQLRLSALDAPSARIRDGSRVAVKAELATAPRPGRFGSSAEVKIRAGRFRGARLLVRAPAWSPFPRGMRVGEEVALAGRMGALAAEGRRDFDDYLRRRGVAGELAVERMRATGRRRGGLAGALDGMRLRAERAVAAGLGPADAALLRGMVLGQDEDIDPVTREDFRASGLAHLLAVSGQNVMLLVALALPLLLLAGVAPHGRLLVLAGLIAIYVPLAGAGPSLQRAAVMGLAGLAAIGASRPASRWYALLLAAVATLAWNPRSAGDPGWQMSFAAVVGILVLGVPLGAVLGRAWMELLPRRSGTARA
jgi:competence protein ComEC